MHIHHVHGGFCLILQMIQNVEYAKVHVNSELKVNMTTKKCTNAWTFTITSKVSLGSLQQTESGSDSCKFHEKLRTKTETGSDLCKFQEKLRYKTETGSDSCKFQEKLR